jgi:serine/threonine-protein kinase
MPIATGGMATVWAARLKGTRGFQKIVAIKTILPQLSEDPTFEQMFLDEASLASRIRHPNVAQILDLGEEAGVLFLVMDWVDGEPLSAVLKAASRDRGSIPLPITVRIISQAAAGLHAAHELRDESGNLLGLVHRDASPQNILVTFDGVVKVVDFGIAKAAGRGSADTNAGQIKGKAAYMSPEQVKGGELDRRTDVFALGTILYLMTTGRHPFRGENDVATLYSISSNSHVILPSRIHRHFPVSLEAVIMKALAKDPDERFASAHDLQRALDMSLPAARRLTTDAEVAAFMDSLLSERHEQGKAALKMALRLADQRAQGRHPSSPSEISQTGLTPPSQISGLTPRGLASTYPSQRDSASDAMHGTPRRFGGQSVGGMTTPADRWTILGNRVSAGARITLASLGLGMAAAMGYFIASRWTNVAAPAPEPMPSAAAVTPPPAVELPVELPGPASSITEAPADSVDSVDKSADAQTQANRPRWAVHSPPHVAPAKSAVAAAQPSAAPKPTSTGTFVPPVRNPGF